MTPPINIDGSTVDAITIDGTEVTEVTADGEVVFGSAIPDSGVSRYEFEQDYTDSWGDNDGTAVGSPTFTTTAKVGSYALDLTGGDYGVDLPNLRSTSLPVSVAMWIYLPSSPATNGRLIDQSGDFDFAINGSSGRFLWEINNNNYWFGSGSTFSTDTWKFVGAAVEQDGTARVVEDDAQVGSDVSTGESGQSTSSNASIGYRRSGSDAYVDMIVDDPRTYDKGLSLTEFENLRTTGSIS